MKIRGVLLSLVLMIVIQACATPPDQLSTKRDGKLFPPPKPPLSSDQSIEKERTIDLSTGSKSPGGAADETSQGTALPSRTGTSHYGLMGSPSQEKSQRSPWTDKERQKIVLNFEKADVAEVTNQIFGDYLKLNYVSDPTLQGRISVYLEGEYSKEELFQMVTKIYDVNNITIVPRNGIYYIQPVQRSASSSLPVADVVTLQDDKSGARPVIIIYRMHYMDASKAINIVKSFLSPGRAVSSDALTNTVIFVENSDNARTIIGILKALDINVFRELNMEIVPVQSITPQDAAQGMEALVNKLAVFKESSLKNNLAFIPLPNFGGVLILAQDPEVLRNAKSWLTALDVQGKETGEQIYVYFAQNSLAADIGNVLTQVYGLGGTSGGGFGQRLVQSTRQGAFGGTGRSGSGTSGFGSSGSRSSGFGSSRSGSSGFGSSGSGSSGFGSSGTGSSGFGSSGFGSSGSGSSSFGGLTGSSGQTSGSSSGALSSFGAGYSQRGGTAAGRLGGGTGTGGQRPPSLTGDVVIIPDEVNNALVIRANAADYAKMRKTIETLDILPRAVLIEVTIAEVNLDNALQYGLEYFFRNINAQIANVPASLAGIFHGGLNIENLATGALPTTPTKSGVATLWTTDNGKIGVLLDLLSEYTNVNVLSTPTLLAVDNKEASIMVGGREPIPTGSYTGAAVGTGVLATVSYEETGVILNLIPHINAGGLVRLEVEQTIRRVGVGTVQVSPGTNAPRFDERNVTTSLLAQSGSTVVIGGIIQTQQDDSHGGIPYLKDMPILGPLFTSKKTNQTRKVELLIAVTPYVIDQRESDVTREFLEKLRNLKSRIEK
jgi:general secretion pathway protein D